MCRKNRMRGGCMIAFGLGLLLGQWYRFRLFVYFGRTDAADLGLVRIKGRGKTPAVPCGAAADAGRNGPCSFSYLCRIHFHQTS